MNAQSAIHVLLRIGTDITGTIARHEEVLDKRGSVWFAKVGKTLHSRNVDRLNAQIQTGTRTFVYFVGKEDREYRWFKGRLEEVSRTKPSAPKLIPDYYSGSDFSSARLWFRISSLEPLDPYVSRTLVIKSSGASAAEAMRSMAAMFIVAERYP